MLQEEMNEVSKIISKKKKRVSLPLSFKIKQS